MKEVFKSREWLAESIEEIPRQSESHSASNLNWMNQVRQIYIAVDGLTSLGKIMGIY